MFDVSVVIPCFNAGAFLDQAVDSALKQRSSSIELEVIVVDDRSTDLMTHTAIDRVQALPGVRVVANRGPRGSAAARNEGVRQAKGTWIAFLDADDWWLENSIATRLDALAEFPDAEWIGADFVELGRDGVLESRGRFERNVVAYDFLSRAYDNSGHPIRIDNPLSCFLQQAPTHTIVTLLKRSLFENVGGFNERLLRQQDYHLFLRLACAASFVYVPRICAYYRYHENNSTRSITDTQKWRVEALWDLLLDHQFFAVRSLLKKKIHGLHLANSYEFRKKGRFVAAMDSAARAILVEPRSARAWRSLAGSVLRN